MNLQEDYGKIFNVLYNLPNGKAVECPAVLIGCLAKTTPVFIAIPREEGFHFPDDFVPVDICREALALLEPALADGTAKVLVATEGFHYVQTYLERSGCVDPQWFTVSFEKCDELYDYASQRVLGLTPIFA